VSPLVPGSVVAGSLSGVTDPEPSSLGPVVAGGVVEVDSSAGDVSAGADPPVVPEPGAAVSVAVLGVSSGAVEVDEVSGALCAGAEEGLDPVFSLEGVGVAAGAESVGASAGASAALGVEPGSAVVAGSLAELEVSVVSVGG
jgi:hypothetical protein